MSGNTHKTNLSPSQIDTLIGVGLRIDGDIACAGVVHVQGEVFGSVSCTEVPKSALVIDTAGSVTGAVNAASVVVRGRLVGPVRATQIIEIQRGGMLVGDVACGGIAIHEGGVIDGLLTPNPPTGGRAEAPVDWQRVADPSLDHASPPPEPAPGAGAEKKRRAWASTAVVLLLIAGATSAWIWRDRAASPAPTTEVALRSDSSLKGGADQQAPAVDDRSKQGEAKASGGETPLAASHPALEKTPAQEPAAERRMMDEERLVTVTGANPSRPAGVFLLISNEPTVLYRKKRDVPGEGSRLAVAEGEKVSVALAPDELIRVAKGKDIVILFQGQKVSRSAIESGAWINFVAR